MSRDLNSRDVTRIVDAPAYGALVAALQAGERDGHNMEAVLNHFASGSHGPSSDNGSDLAAMLHERVTGWLADTLPTATSEGLVAGLVPPRVTSITRSSGRACATSSNTSPPACMPSYARFCAGRPPGHSPSGLHPTTPPPGGTGSTPSVSSRASATCTKSRATNCSAPSPTRIHPQMTNADEPRQPPPPHPASPANEQPQHRSQTRHTETGASTDEFSRQLPRRRRLRQPRRHHLGTPTRVPAPPRPRHRLQRSRHIRSPAGYVVAANGRERPSTAASDLHVCGIWALVVRPAVSGTCRRVTDVFAHRAPKIFC
jgi:hypothetical protein